MLPLRAVLFDVGYGLLDEGPRLAHALGTLAADAGLQGVPRARLEACYEAACTEPGHGSLLVQALEAAGVPSPDAAAARQRLAWDAVPLEAYPDTLATLDRLRARGLQLGVLANQPASARADLERLGVCARTRDTWLSEEAGRSKPDPAFFRMALLRWGLSAPQVAYVGDRPDHDIGPARALGMRTVRLLQGPHARMRARAGEHAHAEAPTLSRAADVLLGWAGASR